MLEPKEYGPIGVVGIGNMGLPMSDHLVRAGFEVVGTARTQKSRDALAQVGGKPVVGADQVAKECRVIFLALPSIPAFHDVCDSILEVCRPGDIIVETSTFPIKDKELEEKRFAERGAVILDCPLSGTGEQAKHKDVVVLGSGDQAAFEKVVPVFQAFTKSQHYLGEFGNGMKMKFVANQMVAIHNVSAAEAVLFGTKMGMDPDVVIKVISEGAGGCRMLEVRGPVMAKRSWTTPQITHKVFHKDIVMIQEALDDVGCPSPLFCATRSIYNAAIAGGHGEHDTSSVYAVLENMMLPSKE
ncbi:MAG: NAD(P)-dependent oxidoreductase [Angelakisella sp.]|nr:NAD(P)-dependent oxidoreductase [Angelakisella sp.]